MGSVFAPSAANLYMNRFEQHFIFNPHMNPYFGNILRFYHFIDDIFCIYTDPPSYDAFVVWLNRLHPTIKFTATGNSQQVNYLDMQVFRTQGNTIAVSPYKKETNKNTYLHYKSFHLRILWHNIPYGQFLRIRHNSTNNKDYYKHSKGMQNDF